MKRDEIILFLKRFKDINQQKYHIIRIGFLVPQPGTVFASKAISMLSLS